MAPRANWKGYLKLSLVSCPVALFPATSASERVSFHLINRETGRRLKQQYVDSVSGDVVEPQDRIRGYEIAKGDYVPVEDDELKDVQIESTHTIDIESFVPRQDIDDVYLDNRYYVAPDDKVGEEAFAVIREAMRKRAMAGLARVVLYGRERIVLLEPRGKGLVATTLRYEYEVRSDKTYFDDIPDVPLSKEMLDLASHIIDTKKGDFDPGKFTDRYQDAVVELIRSKRAGRPLQQAHVEAKTGNVINLMDALKRSLASEKETSVAQPKGKAAPASSARRGAQPATRKAHSGRLKTSHKPSRKAG